MAYMSQDHKKELAPKIKAICKKYNVKASLAVYNHSTLVLNIKSSEFDFDLKENETYTSVNVYWIESHWSGKVLKFLTEVHDAMMIGNHNNSDIMTDYFDIGWYTDINVGKWNKPYIFAGAK